MRVYRLLSGCGLILAMALLAACAPTMGSEPDALGSAAQSGEAGESGSATLPPALVTQSLEVHPTATAEGALLGVEEPSATAVPLDEATPPVVSSENVAVEVTPLTEAELAALPPGQTEPGAAEGEGAPGDDPGATEVVDPERWGPPVAFGSEAYGFELAVPAEFVLVEHTIMMPLKVDVPEAGSFAFMNPETAAVDAVEYEFADFEVRVYPLVQGMTLEQWLQGAGGFLTGAPPPAPFQTAYVSGLEVCQDVMLFPGCASFVAGDGWVYELIAVSLEGQVIMESFRT